MSRGGYLHGFTSKEQTRLKKQAEFLEPFVYENIDLRRVTNLLEVGCGVGAQTSILRRRFPHLRVTGVDSSSKQLASAKRLLAREIRAQHVSLSHEDATRMRFKDGVFDGAFVCWLLEHVIDPVAVLRETLRTLKAGSVIYCTEVQNASFFLQPYSPATLKYWAALNDHQRTMRGDPFVGAKLGNLLIQAGFQHIETRLVEFHFDFRSPKRRAEFIAYWTELMLSAEPALLRSKMVDKRLVDQMKAELHKLAHSDQSVFFYTAVQARAQAL